MHHITVWTDSLILQLATKQPLSGRLMMAPTKHLLISSSIMK
jgi:hypothetical protein